MVHQPDDSENDRFGIEDYLLIFAMATLGLGGSLFVANLVILGWDGVRAEGLGIGSLIMGGTLILIMLNRLNRLKDD